MEKPSLTTPSGKTLPDDSIESVVIDKQDNIVIGTNFGIAVLKCFTPKLQDKNPQVIPAQNDKNNDDLKSYMPVFKIYNYQTGYPVKDVNGGSNNGAMYCDSKGNIWAGTGTDKGSLIQFDPTAVNENPNPPTVVIQNVKINDENVPGIMYLLPLT